MGREDEDLDRMVRTEGGAEVLVRVVKSVVVRALQFRTVESENELVSAVCLELLSSAEPITRERISATVEKIASETLVSEDGLLDYVSTLSGQRFDTLAEFELWRDDNVELWDALINKPVNRGVN
jgi:RIO-like serine/threonine protein kinase